ncbi:MAG: DUF2993 domain-containing protein [Bacillota bacterium]
MKKLMGIILAVLILSQLALPAYFGQRVEVNLANQLISYQSLEVNLSSYPALLMLTGDVQQVRLTGKELVADDLRVAEIYAEFSDVQFKSLLNHEQELTTGANDKLRVVLLEQDLEKYLTANLSSLQEVQLDLGSQQTKLAGRFDLFGNQLDLKLTGNFILRSDSKLAFKVKDLQVAELMIPGDVVNRFMEETDLVVDLSKLPLPLSADQVQVKQDQLIILGGIAGADV